MIPAPIIIILPEAGGRWIGGTRAIKTPSKRSKSPTRPPQPIPTFDRRAFA
jgi:hypothetical protein